jgi:hypothetical protein
MLIHLDNHALVNDLCAHFSRSGFRTQSVGGGMVQVIPPSAPTEDQGRRDLLLHLRVWEVVNPEATTAIVS